MTDARDTDQALLAAWREGDRDAGAALFERYYACVARFFRNKVPDAAEDLIQRTFMALVEARERFAGASSLRTYLFAIAHNQLRLHFRARVAGRRDIALADVELSASDVCPGPSALVARREEQRLLLEALRRIPLAYQVVLELHYWESQTADQIARIVGVPPGTAKTRLRRGRELLERRVAEIAASREVLDSTLEDLDGWAHDLREQLGRTET